MALDFKHELVDAGHGTPCHYPLARQGHRRALNPSGYVNAILVTDGVRRDSTAHRLRYEAANGPIPNGMLPDHLCRNRWCCNPEHIEVVTPAENLRRGLVAKLTRDDVAEIRSLRAGGMSTTAIAARFGVSQSTASRVSRGQQWADGPCPAWEIVKARRANGSRPAPRGTCHL